MPQSRVPQLRGRRRPGAECAARLLGSDTRVATPRRQLVVVVFGRGACVGWFWGGCGLATRPNGQRIIAQLCGALGRAVKQFAKLRSGAVNRRHALVVTARER